MLDLQTFIDFSLLFGFWIMVGYISLTLFAWWMDL
jgi:hypothetical protein